MSAAVEVEVLVTARSPMPEGYAFRPTDRSRLKQFAAVVRPGGKTLPSPCLAFVVRHPSAGTILIDTGFHPDATTSPRKDFGVLMATLFRNLKPADEPYDAQLRTAGVDPAAVERVVMTHLHVDHTSGMRLLPS